uniref:Uncharacterized protein n=1 Tax=Pseudomonas phage Touem01 TaxID=3138548 RepID=A0AAU6W327_9VIRU
MTNKPNDMRVSRELLERVSSQELGMTAKKCRQAAAQELRALLAQPADQQGEPFAWARIYTGFNDHADADSKGFQVVAFHQNPNAPELETHIPLYRHAQPATAKVDERAEFEAWHNIRYPMHSMLLSFCERTGGYSYISRRVMFELWQARAKLNGGQS